eukprot:TRINITY_DN50237_c0_g1_i1.p1 TRINITY_DN50237_c0_g1~~TRINITY_DN50237_c0_g1_i1.p1  ORF type:complete len:249 (-),score=12.17 TRINITY_DN50237_c0_g1_i1:13-759(-)
MEKPTCRICWEDESEGELFVPCRCSGTQKYVHRTCLAAWHLRGAISNVRFCPTCGYEYRYGFAGVGCVAQAVCYECCRWCVFGGSFVATRFIGYRIYRWMFPDIRPFRWRFHVIKFWPVEALMCAEARPQLQRILAADAIFDTCIMMVKVSLMRSLPFKIPCLGHQVRAFSAEFWMHFALWIPTAFLRMLEYTVTVRGRAGIAMRMRSILELLVGTSAVSILVKGELKESIRTVRRKSLCVLPYECDD